MSPALPAWSQFLAHAETLGLNQGMKMKTSFHIKSELRGYSPLFILESFVCSHTVGTQTYPY